MSQPWSDRPLDWIKPRELGANPRCPACKSEAHVSGAHRPPPMFHAAHPYGSCQVLLEDGTRCGCTVGVESPTRPS